jgi:hypothetical protein
MSWRSAHLHPLHGSSSKVKTGAKVVVDDLLYDFKPATINEKRYTAMLHTICLLFEDLVPHTAV